MESKMQFFSEYNIQLIVGTLDPQVEGYHTWEWKQLLQWGNGLFASAHRKIFNSTRA